MILDDSRSEQLLYVHMQLNLTYSFGTTDLLDLFT